VRRSIVILIALLLPWGADALAQEGESGVSKVATTAAPFLEIPVGARATAMGNAFVANANDVTCLFWNPSFMALLPQGDAVFSHSSWIGDMSFDYAAVAVPLGDFGALGLSFTSLSMDDMAVRTVERPEGTGEQFSAGSFAIGIHYARTLSEWFAIGFTVKYIDERIWHMKATAFALDVGTVFTTDLFNGFRIGATITNFGTKMQLSGRDTRTFHRIDPNKFGSNDRIPQNIELDSWNLPMNIQFGIAADLVKSESVLLTVAADALHPADNYESVNAGMELGLFNTFFLRAGAHSLFLVDGEGGLSAGAGVLADLFGGGLKAYFDYGYTDYGRLSAVHVFAIGLRF
jgi:hypothetical protein